MATTNMSEFNPGFASRHYEAGEALRRAFEVTPVAFAPQCLSERPAARPKHFSPADPTANPTEGWDPFDPAHHADTQFVDPVSAAHEAGFAEGYAAARAEIEGMAADQAALIGQIAAALSTGAHFDRDTMASRLRQTVLHLVTRLVGEVGIAPDVLVGRIDAAVDMLADSAESAMLRMHPDDVPLVEGKLPATVFPLADASIARGAFVIESASTVVEDGPDMWIEQLAQAIDRIPLPPC